MSGGTGAESGAKARPVRRRTVLPIVFVVVGIGVIAVTWASQAGLVTGVEIQWPANIVGAVALFFGVLGLLNREVPLDRAADPVVPDAAPIRESGLDDTEVLLAERMDAEARFRAAARASGARFGDPGGGGGS